MTMGRPTLCTPDTSDAICEGIADGKSLEEILRAPGMPTSTTVRRWIRENEDFRRNYASAREDQAHADDDKIRQITHKVLGGELDPAAARVAIDALKWTAGKRLPKIYGDKSTLDVNVVHSELSDAELLDSVRKRAERLGLPIPDAEILE